MAIDAQKDDGAPSIRLPLSLGRNGACLPCRKRKMRCDGIRPMCANCEKVITKKRWRSLVCAWEDKPDTGRGSRRRKESGQYPLESEAEGQTQHASSSQSGSTRQSSAAIHTDANMIPLNTDDSQSLVRSRHPSPTMLSLNSALVGATGTGADLMDGVEPRSSTGWSPVPLDLLTSGVTGLDSKTVRRSSDNEMDWHGWTSGMIPSNWPTDLPGPDVILRVCKLFFERVPTLPKMLHRRTFLQSLLLPPTHKDFPAPCLLHAILAITAPHLPPSTASDPAYLPQESVSQPSGQEHPVAFEDLLTALRNLGGSFHLGSQETPDHPLGAFQLWHRRKAFAKVSETFDRGGDMVQAVQAQCIATTVDRYNAWWTDVWQEAGASVRLAIPLGLNESQRLPVDGLKRSDNLKPPVMDDPVQRAIEDRTWWMCYLTEREFGMSTAWTEAIPDDEISVELPVTQALFDAGVGDLRGTQTLHSEDLFYAHPPVHSDCFSLLIKAVKLFSEVNKFYRKYSRISHTIAGFLSHPTFQGLMCRINAMRKSFPRDMRRPTRPSESSEYGGFDVDLIAAAMTVQAATLTLLEPCITREMYKSAAGQLAASSIRAVEHMLHEVNATAFDITLLPSVCPFVWSLCGKGLVKFIAAANERGDGLSIGIYRSELEVFRLAMIQHGQRYPVATRYLKVLDEAARQSFGDKNMAFQCTSDQILDPSYQPSSFKDRPVDGTNGAHPSTPQATNDAQVPAPQLSQYDSAPFSGRPSLSRNSSIDQSHWNLQFGGSSTVPSEQSGYPVQAKVTGFPGTWASTWSITPLEERTAWLNQTPTTGVAAMTGVPQTQYAGLGQYFVYGTSGYSIPTMAGGSGSNPVTQSTSFAQPNGQPIEMPLIDLASSQNTQGMSYDQGMPVLSNGNTAIGQDETMPASSQPQSSTLDWDSAWKEFINMDIVSK